MYSHNLTNSLKSLHILVQPPEIENASKTTFLLEDYKITSSGTLYRTMPWRLPPPYQTNSTKLIDNSTDATNCLLYCDVEASCIAVQTRFDKKGNFSKCFLISNDEYYPDNSSFPKGNETSFIQLKVTNIDNTLFHSQNNFNQEYQETIFKNDYVSIINAANRYELNEPLAEKLSNSL